MISMLKLCDIRLKIQNHYFIKNKFRMQKYLQRNKYLYSFSSQMNK